MEQGEGTKFAFTSHPKMLLSTLEASRATGLSQCELRTGWKQGKYPALVIGRGGQRQRLRWRLDLLEAAIEKAMEEKAVEDELQIVRDWENRRRAAGR